MMMACPISYIFGYLTVSLCNRPMVHVPVGNDNSYINDRLLA